MVVSGSPAQNADPALVLIHGFPLDRRIWAPQVDFLAPTHRLIPPDLPGFGVALHEKSIQTMDDYAKWLLAMLDGLGVGSFILGGHSMGGYIAFAMHRLAPERLAGLALISTRSAADSPETAATRETNAEKALKEGPGFLADAMLPKLFGGDPPPARVTTVRSMIEAATSAGAATALRAMASRPDAGPQLSALKMPVLVVAGRQDQIVPAAESEAMAKAIPGARLVWAEKSGHMPMLEEPDLVNRELLDLMKRSTAARPQ
jgi:3-oxoadipate enol-lactonase